MNTSTLYYSSLPVEDRAKAPSKRFATPKGSRSKSPVLPRSPSKTKGNGVPTRCNTMTDNAHSARKLLKNAFCSFVPKRLLLSPYVANKTTSKDESSDEDVVTPVIYYIDEDAVAAKEESQTFVDPFAFVGNDDEVVEAKEEIKPKPVSSPTSVVPMELFTVMEESSDFGDDDEAIFFDDPFFPKSLTRIFDENTSIDVSEGIRSINVSSVSDEVKNGEDPNNGKDDDESMNQWFGFFNSPNFTSYEWDPTFEDTLFDHDVLQMEESEEI